MQRIRAFTSLGLILAGEFVVLGFLAAADWIPSALEILDAPPDAAIYGMARMIAIGLTAWLFITTIAVVLAHVSRIPTAIRTIEWITIPLISRMAQRVTALSIVAAGLAAPTSSLATEPPPIPVVVVSGHTTVSPTTVVGPIVETEAATPNVPSPMIPRGATGGSVDFDISVSSEHPERTAARRSPDASHLRYTVRPGDNMWSITASYLAEQLDRPPSNAQISEVWRAVMDLNESSIRSGDVDLIFAGEQLILPPVTIGG